MERRLIPLIAGCLGSVTHPRFFETERGFQGEFLTSLRAAFPKAGLPGDAIVEQEYQKRFADHQITLRPDVIMHVPTPKGGNRKVGNFVVIELKLGASPAAASNDFESLDTVLRALDYPLGVFVNIAGNRTHAEQYKGPYPDRIHCFGVELTDDGVRVTHARPTRK